ncbi:MAG TPA: SPFH domain-containing protein [bacterium]|nr:SPFH domain-containing protein [bacterium]
MAADDKDKVLREDLGTGPGCLGKTALGAVLALAALLIVVYFGCLERVNSWEVGVRYWNILIPGIKAQGTADKLEPGWNLVAPFLNEFRKYNCAVQRFEMAPAFPGMPAPDLPPLSVRTAKDQDSIDVYVTILYRVNRPKANTLRAHYSDDAAIRQKGIAAKCPDILQGYLGEIMTANQFYSMTREKRQAVYRKRKTDPEYQKDLYPSAEYLYDRSSQAAKAMEQMNIFFESQGGGVTVDAVLIWDFKFKDEIEASIISKVIANERVEMQIAVKEEAEEYAKLQQLEAEADAAYENELARGTAESRRIGAEAKQYETEKLALGDKLVLEAQAAGKGKINRALTGSGGRTYVGLEYAKALEGLDLIILPAGPDGLNPLDLDQTLKKLAPPSGGTAP